MTKIPKSVFFDSLIFSRFFAPRADLLFIFFNCVERCCRCKSPSATNSLPLGFCIELSQAIVLESNLAVRATKSIAKNAFFLVELVQRPRKSHFAPPLDTTTN